jgi:predicted AlkP superfamily pyrophosphatase or phosphodiesterase
MNIFAFSLHLTNQMKNSILVLLTLLASHTSPSQSMNVKPKLVVGIVVDQMRQDYLYRYFDKYGEDGFKKLLTEGFEYKNAHYNYVPTFTGPGHASIYTGTTPRNHGIIANEWYDRYTKDAMYCAGDATATAVGGTGTNGNISARNLLSTTVTDELRMFTNEQAKVVGIALKDRGAALPAGHNPTGAYWYESASGQFMTSSYYRDELPQWVVDFNDQNLVVQYFLENWETLYPIEQYTESLADDSSYEKILGKRDAATFPYEYNKMVRNGNSIIRTTPHGNTLTTAFAIAAIKGESLGEDSVTDFLALSYSSTDYAGHAFGPRSVEIEDIYLRLDIEIANLMKFLDTEIGKDEYVIFLTADHGVVDVPQYLLDRKYPGGYYSLEQAEKEIGAALIKKFGRKEWVMNVSNGQIFLDRQLIQESKIPLSEIQQFIAEQLVKYDYISDVFTATDLAKRDATDPTALRLQNGFNFHLSGDVLIVTNSGFLPDALATQGTTHGTGFNYDTHVPILFYGMGIPSGSSVRAVSITDIAPSVSMMLDISLPSASTGKVLLELFE